MNGEREGANMGLVRGSQWVVWGGLAVLLYAGLANHGRDVKVALARLDGPDVRATLARPDAAPADSDLSAARLHPDVRDAGPGEQMTLAKPAIEGTPRKAEDEA